MLKLILILPERFETITFVLLFILTLRRVMHNSIKQPKLKTPKSEIATTM